MADDKTKPVKSDQQDLVRTQEEDIKLQVQRLLSRPVNDEKRALEIIVEAITSKYVDSSLVEQVVKQTVFNYETKLRVFAIAAANRQLNRILRLITILDDLEEELGKPERFRGMDDKELVKLYAVVQSNLSTSLDYVKKVIDFRLELQQAQASMLSPTEKESIDAMSGLPMLDSHQRDKVRRLIQGIAEDVTKMAETGEAEIIPKEDK